MNIEPIAKEVRVPAVKLFEGIISKTKPEKYVNNSMFVDMPLEKIEFFAQSRPIPLPHLGKNLDEIA